MMIELKKQWGRRGKDSTRYICGSGNMFQHQTLTDYVQSRGLAGLVQRCLPGTDAKLPQLLAVFREP